MITFRCKRSGNTINVHLPDDIESMRKHEGYEEVKEEAPEEKREVLKLRKKEKNVS